jgi:hypothetical protein
MGVEDDRLLLVVFYEGPWGRLCSLVYGIRKDGTLRYEIPENPKGWRWVLGALGDFFDRRDVAWRNRHVTNRTKPCRTWKRKSP